MVVPVYTVVSYVYVLYRYRPLRVHWGHKCRLRWVTVIRYLMPFIQNKWNASRNKLLLFIHRKCHMPIHLMSSTAKMLLLTYSSPAEPRVWFTGACIFYSHSKGERTRHGHRMTTKRQHSTDEPAYSFIYLATHSIQTKWREHIFAEKLYYSSVQNDTEEGIDKIDHKHKCLWILQSITCPEWVFCVSWSAVVSADVLSAQ